ncbi:MAG TPA: aminoglycoside phosphotransferase family protein [Acidimicrobiales bacterium]|nr:aminoglycoside phosphotransferase family protein [Acidimicrobiales bacterium]
MRIPAGLERLRADTQAWFDELPARVDQLSARWGLTVDEPYDGGATSWVAPVALDDGSGAVLKVQWPHREVVHEAEALRRWGGEGAIRLLDHDPERHALLVERCEPGTHLGVSRLPHAEDVIIGLVRRLAVPVGPPFGTLEDEAAHWAEALPRTWEAAGRPFEADLVGRTLGLLQELGPSQGEQVLLHQDLHGDNVLAAEREPWLAIDPKPLAGEIEFAPAPIVRSKELGHSRADVRRRLDRCCDELDLDRERARGWAFAQTVAWAVDGSDAMPEHVQTARWLIG